MLFDNGQFFIGYITGQDIGRRGTDDSFFIFIQKPDALLCGIRSLIKLSRKIFYGEHGVSLILRERFLIEHIYGRL